jgi:hypothetical protein
MPQSKHGHSSATPLCSLTLYTASLALGAMPVMVKLLPFSVEMATVFPTAVAATCVPWDSVYPFLYVAQHGVEHAQLSGQQCRGECSMVCPYDSAGVRQIPPAGTEFYFV